MADVVPPLVELGIKLVDFFQKKAEKRDAIQYLPRHVVGEHLSRPLGEMFGYLIRADTEMELYLRLLAVAQGTFKNTLVENSSKFLFPRIEVYLNSFWQTLDSIEKMHPQVNESIKGNACTARDYYGQELVKQLGVYQTKCESGMPLAAHDIIGTLEAYKRVTDCFATGILAAIEDLPHAGRALQNQP